MRACESRICRSWQNLLVNCHCLKTIVSHLSGEKWDGFNTMACMDFLPNGFALLCGSTGSLEIKDGVEGGELVGM